MVASRYRDVLAMLGSFTTFVRDSPKRLRWFESLQQGDARALRPYCNGYCTTALTSVLINYNELMTFTEEVNAEDKGNAGAKSAGFANQMYKFELYFSLLPLKKVLQKSER